MKQQLLLLEDIEGLGRSGDLVFARPGYVRNFLLPQKKAFRATGRTLKMQELLRKQRLERAAFDKLESESLSSKLAEMVFEFFVKVDPEQRMYGSVTVTDLIQSATEKGLHLERKSFPSSHYALKELGRKLIPLRLKEGVIAHLVVDIFSEAARD
ncbi:MAG: 50S ribosomal protein L9 [Victivallaceae bacterium]